MNKKLTTPQVLLSAAIIATILTISGSVIEWEKKIHAGIFAFIIALLASKIAQLIIKEEPAEE